ncbi:MAG: heme-binding protein [Chromatiales bacterium]|nr:MAG: heme-binding protein [Chromatiales bacterium]
MKLAHRIAVILFFLLVMHPAMAIEEPAYDVLVTADDYEIRRYAPYIVAEVDVDGDMKKSGNDAFRILAGYIFGDNEPGEKMAMTAPVTTKPAGQGQRMNMTAPVLSSPAEDATEAYTCAFVMESRFSMESLPKPLDSRIRLVEIPTRVVAARRYSGSWSNKNFLKNQDTLLAALQGDGVVLSGQPWLARYNSPITPWFLRRNEVLVEIEWHDE